MQKVYFSIADDPTRVSEFKSVTIKPRWLMTAAIWVLRKLGFQVWDLRD